jgi:hypothetical protein
LAGMGAKVFDSCMMPPIAMRMVLEPCPLVEEDGRLKSF